MATLLEAMIANGIPEKAAMRIIAQAEKTEKPKVKKSNAFFAGSATKKVDKEIDVLVICDCCGASEHQKKTIKATPDSPDTMKVSTQLCNKCPDFFRKLSHEELVTLALVRHHGGFMAKYPRDSSQVKLAKQHKPEDIINLHVNG